MSKKWLILVMTLIVLLITMPLLAACDDDDDDEVTKTIQPTETAEPTEIVTPTETQAQSKEGKLKIGWLCSITGASASSRDHSVDLAIEEINEAGGVQVGDTTYMLELSVQDDKMLASGAISGIMKLLDEDKVSLVRQQSMTSPQLVRPYTEEAKVLHFVQQEPHDWISPEHPYSFYNGADSSLYDLIILDWVSKNRPDIKTVAAIKLLASDYEERGEVHRKLVPAEYGIEFTDYEFFEMANRDFYPILTKALQGDPDAIIVESNMGFMVIKQARELGFKGLVLIGGDMPDHWYAMLTDEELDGIISLAPPLDSPLVLQAYKDYLESYDQVYNGRPYSYEMVFMSGYVGVYIYAAALKAAGSTDADKVREVMETQTLTLEFPSGEKLDVRFSGQDQFGENRYIIPTPEYLSVHRMDKPELLEVVEQDKLYEYRALYDRYRVSD